MVWCNNLVIDEYRSGYSHDGLGRVNLQRCIAAASSEVSDK